MLTNADRKIIAEARQLANATSTADLREAYAAMGGAQEYANGDDLRAALLGRASAMGAELAGMVERRERTITELRLRLAEVSQQLLIAEGAK